MGPRAPGRDARDKRQERNIVTSINTGPSQGSLSISDAGPDSQNHQRVNTPYTLDLSNPSTTSAPATDTLGKEHPNKQTIGESKRENN